VSVVAVRPAARASAHSQVLTFFRRSLSFRKN
jgi:hypothetical protein